MKIGTLKVYGIIYKIENLVNGKVYIGQTIQDGGFDARYSARGEGIERVYKSNLQHRNNKKNYNTYLVRSIEKYGFNNFKVNKIFDVAFSKEELDIKEDIWINYFDCIKNGYNNQGGGSNGKLSEESRIKMSNSAKKRFENKENSPLYGKNHSIKSRIKISLSQRGKLNHKSKQIVCINDFKVFESLRICSKYYYCSHGGVSKVCNHEREETNGFKFMFLEEYINLGYDETKLIYCDINLEKEILYPKDKQINEQRFKKEIICINNGLIFESASDCEKNSELIFGEKMNSECIRKVCRGERKHYKNFEFKFTYDLSEMEIEQIKENAKVTSF